ncbi:LLM class flavin-dependent oxidoreductase, partial [Rubrivirga sp.]|uniref:LLM class flavin-dependent oxidoreductase n=1 Tax=Rubrivirga sp. TaxID=1885344 RepID=UPI003C762AD3
ARLGLPLALAIIGGQPHRFAPLVDLYRQAGGEAGHDAQKLKVSINGHGFLADTTEAAVEVAHDPFMETMGRIGRERGWPPPSRAQFDAERRLDGALVLGSPQEAIDKILYQHGLFGHDRHLVQLTVGPIEHAQVLRAIELFGTEVAPVVRREVGVPA